jgi:hypothetical protein
MRPSALFGVTCSSGRAGRCVFLVLGLAACTREADQNLWRRDFATSPPVRRGEVAGYWQGDIALGKVRAKIESGRLTLAIRCDSDGKLVAQGSAPVTVQPGKPSVMALQADLQSDSGDEVCGFRFYRGNQFAFGLRPDGVLKINFAGTSVSELTKIADLENAR